MAEKKLLQLLDSISIDKNTNLLPTTLKDGVTCLGVEGDVAPLSITEDATATANDMAAGVTAYINNEKVEGTLEVIPSNSTVGVFSNESFNDALLHKYTVNTKLEEKDRLVRAGASLQTNIEYGKLATEIGLTPEKILEGNTILDIEGTATSDATAEAGDIVMGKSAYVGGEKIEGTAFEIPADGIYQEKWNEEITIEDSATGDKTYLKFVGNPTDDNYMLRPNSTVEMITELSTFTDKAGITPEKIIEGNTVLGVVGTGTTGVDTSDATATAEFIANGKTAYVNDEKVTGTADHYVTSDDTIILASAAVTENVMGLDCVTYTTPIQNGLCSTPTMFISGEKDFRLALPVDRIASAIELTPEKILEGNTILGVVGTAKQEEGTKVYGTLEELQAVTGTEGQFAIVNSGETFDGAYKYTNGAWVEMFSSRRYDNTLTPAEYEQAVATATDIQGGNE